MEDFKSRLKKEFNELLEKTHKLDSFIETNKDFMKLSDIDRSLLVVQKDIMSSYLGVLTERLRLLK